MHSYLCKLLLLLTWAQVTFGSLVNITIADRACKGLLVDSKKLYVVTAAHCVLPATPHGIQTKNILVKIDDQIYLRTIKKITFSTQYFEDKALPLLITGKNSDMRSFCIHHHQNDIAVIELAPYNTGLTGLYIYSKDQLKNYPLYSSSHFSTLLNGADHSYIFKGRSINNFSIEGLQYAASFTSQSDSIVEGDSGSPLVLSQKDGKSELKIIGVASCYTSNSQETVKYNKFAVWNQRLQTALEN